MKMCSECQPKCKNKKSSSSSNSNKKKQGIGVKGWATLGIAGFVGISMAAAKDPANTANAASAPKVDFGALSSKYDDLFAQDGAKYGVSPVLLAAQAKQESAFNSQARSPKGAQGLMQLMPKTAQSLGVTDPYDPVQAVDGAARLMAQLKKQFGSDELALAAYNAGPGNVQKAGNHVPKITETQNYVAKIEASVRSVS